MHREKNLDKFKDAYHEDFKFNDENRMMLEWYVSRIINRIKGHESTRMLSLGIGHQTVSQTIINVLDQQLDAYFIVEGSSDIIKLYKQKNKLPSHVNVVHSYFETFKTSESFDFIEMGFILEHVDNPEEILNRYKTYVKKQGSIFIAVPNAKSLHRIIGHKAGYLSDPFMLSPHDLALGHKRYFDLEGLKKLVISSGLEIKRIEGVYLKPLTTDQIANLRLDNSILHAMMEVGIDYPEICNAIYIEAGI